MRPGAHRFETLAESGFGYSSYSDPVSVGQWGGGYRVDDDKGNPELKPEVKTETEFGVDFRFMDDKLSLSLTSYQRKSRNECINLDFGEIGVEVYLSLTHTKYVYHRNNCTYVLASDVVRLLIRSSASDTLE